jgi:Methyltransferase domain
VTPVEGLAGRAKRIWHRLAAWLVGVVLRPGAVYDPANFEFWERHGYHITPVHYYEPIPDTRELLAAPKGSASAWGLDLRPDYQLSLLRDEFPRFASEYNALPAKPAAEGEFSLSNDAFRGIDPLVYYCMIRHYQPGQVVEVGSGYSTLLAALAGRQNARPPRQVVIDPWPRDFIARGLIRVEHLAQKAEATAPELFLSLGENDILFVDSSHVVRTGGDVRYLLLDIVPRLAPGVIVHFHDIYLPFDYPREMAAERHIFWTEQYLLQAYLADNCRAEVLFGSHYVAQAHQQAVAAAFPQALELDGGSFWFRKGKG